MTEQQAGELTAELRNIAALLLDLRAESMVMTELCLSVSTVAYTPDVLAKVARLFRERMGDIPAKPEHRAFLELLHTKTRAVLEALGEEAGGH